MVEANDKICSYLKNHIPVELGLWLYCVGGENLQLNVEVITLINGKFKLLKQKPLDGKLYL